MIWWKEPDRIVPLVLGSYFASSSIPLYSLWREGGGVVSFYDWAWPWVFLTAGVFALAYAALPRNALLSAYSGGLMVACTLSRAGAVALTWLNGDTQWYRAVFAILTWLAFGYLIGRTWSRGMSRLAAARRR